jgi:hypothetical protein
MRARPRPPQPPVSGAATPSPARSAPREAFRTALKAGARADSEGGGGRARVEPRRRRARAGADAA